MGQKNAPTAAAFFVAAAANETKFEINISARRANAVVSPLLGEPNSMATATHSAILPRNTHSIAVGYVAWLFGFLGVHRFYYGKPVTGTIWFFTGGLLLIGWIIDFFLIPSMDAQADRRYWPGRIDYNIAWVLLVIPFFGLIGLHRFYMGKAITGLIWLFTAGLFGLGWLYDLWTLNEQVSELNARG
jgi:TM2 domain-containing membrane protein YozV